jgi:regulator of ribonuclease activity A
MDRIFSTADLCDDFEDRCASCETRFEQYGGRRSFFGQIHTVKCVGDNVLVRRALETRSDGAVLVVDGAHHLGSALLGDMMAILGVNNGWSGVVIYGAIRDAVRLRELDFGVKALGTNPRRSGKIGVGQESVVVSFGGVSFVPGQWLYSDDDGILVSAEKLQTP